MYTFVCKLAKIKEQSDLTSKLAPQGVGDWTSYAPEVPSNPNYSMILTSFSMVMFKKFLEKRCHYLLYLICYSICNCFHFRLSAKVVFSIYFYLSEIKWHLCNALDSRKLCIPRRNCCSQH